MKTEKPGAWRPSFRQMCWAGAAYFAGCALYTAHHAKQAELPLGQTVIVTGLSVCLGFVMPLMSGIVGHEVGRGLGALTGEVGAVGYKMAQPKTPERARKIEAFKQTAVTFGKTVGITAAVVAGFWGFDQFMRQTMDDSALKGGGRKHHHASIIKGHHASQEKSDTTGFFAPIPA